MSILVVCKCNIANAQITEDILKKAVENVAGEYHSKVKTTVLDYCGNTQEVLAGFVAPRLDGGIGVRLKDGIVEFVYDPHLQNEYYEDPEKQKHCVEVVKDKLEEEIKRLTAEKMKIGLLRALAKSGFKVKPENIKRVGNKLIIEGEK